MKIHYTFLTIVEVTEILCSLKLVLEGKTGKEIPESSKFKKKNLKKKLYGPFLWMGFNCLKAIEPLQGGTLLFTLIIN